MIIVKIKIYQFILFLYNIYQKRRNEHEDTNGNIVGSEKQFFGNYLIEDMLKLKKEIDIDESIYDPKIMNTYQRINLIGPLKM